MLYGNNNYRSKLAVQNFFQWRVGQEKLQNKAMNGNKLASVAFFLK